MRFSFNLLAVSCLLMFISTPSLSQDTVGRDQGPPTPSAAEIAEESRLSASLVELYKQQKFDEALLVGRQLLVLRERLFGSQHPLVANSLSDLAEIYLARQKDSEAEQLYTRVVNILERKPALDSVLLSVSLERLAGIKFAKREYETSARFLERSLAVRQKVVSEEDPSLAPILHALANVYRVLNRFDNAEPLYFRSLAIMEKTLGREHPDTIQKMKDYACAHYNAFDLRRDKSNKDEQENSSTGLRQRAICWLFGFKTDCASADSDSKPPGTVLNGRAISLPKPSYPLSAKEARAQGRLTVAVLIDEKGNVIKAKTVCRNVPQLREAAEAAARDAKFQPPLVDGKPIEVTGVIVYNFILP